MLTILIPFGTAIVLAQLITPVVIRGAHRTGILDIPADDRRAHTTPVPRLGGVAVMMAVGLTWLTKSIIDDTWWNPFGSQHGDLLIGLAIGTGLIIFAGVIDDIRGLSPRLKLVVQIGAAPFVVAYGLVPDAIALVPGGPISHVGEVVGTGVLIFWIVGVSNAFNLIDGIDGLASSFALVALSVIVAGGLILGGGLSPMAPAVIAGGILGFLPYNWRPARVFLGDSGSMTLGFLLAVLSVVAATDANGVTYPIVPLCALAFPLSDTFIAMTRRWIRAVPFSVADGRHIHHRMCAGGLSVPRTVVTLVLTFMAIAGLGLAILWTPPRFTAAVVGGGGVLIMTILVSGLRWLGYVEFDELGDSVKAAVRHARRRMQVKIHATEAAARIDEATSIDQVRRILAALSEDVGLLDIELLGPGAKDTLTPPSQQIARLDALPVRLDYPFAFGTGSAEQRATLRLWGARGDTHDPQRMEAVAHRIGPAVQTWYVVHVEAGIRHPKRIVEAESR